MLNTEHRMSFLFSHRCAPILNIGVRLRVSAENKYIRPSSDSIFKYRIIFIHIYLQIMNPIFTHHKE
jgi:hypothetical protein